MLTITITIVMLAFTFQLTLINFIKSNDLLTKNLIQNPISEDEEEETEDNLLSQFINTHQEFQIFISLEFADPIKYTNCIDYRFQHIKLYNPPPESNC